MHASEKTFLKMKVSILLILSIVGIIAIDAKIKSGSVKLMGKLGKRLSLKLLKKLASGAAKSTIAASMMEEIGVKNHGRSWNMDYYDQKFQTIQATFEMVEEKLEHLSIAVEQIELTMGSSKTNNIIMKSVLFVFLALTMSGLAFALWKMRNNIYLKRMRALINNLASLKTDYKNRMHVLRTKEDVELQIRREAEMHDHLNSIHRSPLSHDSIRQETEL